MPAAMWHSGAPEAASWQAMHAVSSKGSSGLRVAPTRPLPCERYAVSQRSVPTREDGMHRSGKHKQAYVHVNLGE
eukprot:1161014-Pelagomonas_calceolata.AAC.1